MGASVRARSRGLPVSNRVLASGGVLGAERNAKREGASPPRRRLDCEVTIVHSRNLARQPQPEAGSRNGLGALGLDPNKAAEEARLVFLRDPYALVGDRDFADSLAADADVVLVGSYFPDAIAVTRALLNQSEN